MVRVTITADKDDHALPDPIEGEGDTYAEALADAAMSLLDSLGVNVNVSRIDYDEETWA